MGKFKVLFICKGNSGRSQLAEAYFNANSDKPVDWDAISAGTEPDPKIHPWIVEFLRKDDIDISRKKPKLLTKEVATLADRIILMDSDILTSIPKDAFSKIEIWDVGRLFGQPKKEVAKVKDVVKRKIVHLTNQIRSGRQA